MITAPIPHDDASRVAALNRYCVLDTAPEPAFDRLTALARYLLSAPTALVALVDAERQWFKSHDGLDASETPRNISFCGHAVFHREALVVPDATQDDRFADNPLVTGPLGLRFYAGAPLINSDGFVLGTLCIIDYVKRPAPSMAEMTALRHLADAVVDALEMRTSLQAVSERHRVRSEQSRLSHSLARIAGAANEASRTEAAVNVIVRALCAFTRSAGGHVLLRDAASDLMSTKLWHGRNSARFEGLRNATNQKRPQHMDDIASRAIRERRAVVIPDLTSEAWPRARAAAEAGLRSAFAVPIMIGPDIHGVVECFSTRAGSLSTDQVTVLDFVGAQLGRLAEREHMARLKNEFVSTVSHELRTPLTSIAGALELLDAGVTGELPEEAADMVAIAHNNSRRLVRLINDILDIEKIEGGRMPFDLSPQLLEPLLARAIAETASFATSLGVRIAFDAQVPTGAALIDADRFIQVVTNLLSNAAKFSPKGEAVTVTLARVGANMRVSVADRGPGIPETFRERIFEKFAQADGSDSRRLAGTGLGLAIVKNIVSRFDGAISFETECGRGTIFHVDLPECRMNDAQLSAHAVSGG